MALPYGFLAYPHLLERLNKPSTYISTLWGQCLVGLLELVKRDGGIPVVNPMISLVVLEKISPSGEVGSGAGTGVEMFLDFGPILKNGERPNEWQEPIQDQNIQETCPCAKNKQGQPE